jgi:hypothetical protein
MKEWHKLLLVIGTVWFIRHCNVQRYDQGWLDERARLREVLSSEGPRALIDDLKEVGMTLERAEIMQQNRRAYSRPEAREYHGP